MPSISIGQHLINRLKEINIDVIFGVPGDFNMVCLLSSMSLQKKTNSVLFSPYWISLKMMPSLLGETMPTN